MFSGMSAEKTKPYGRQSRDNTVITLMLTPPVARKAGEMAKRKRFKGSRSAAIREALENQTRE